MGKEKITLADGGSITYCLYSTPRNGLKENQRVLGKGDTIVGTFVGLTDPSKDKYGNAHIRVRSGSGDLFQLNSSGKLNALMGKIEVGSEVEITYLGKDTIKSGKWEGEKANNFEVYKIGAPAAKAVGSSEDIPF